MSSSGSESESGCFRNVRDAVVGFGGDGRISQRLDRVPEVAVLWSSVFEVVFRLLSRGGGVLSCLVAFTGE
jgi:hypothetical protein